MSHALWHVFDAVADALPDRDAVMFRDERSSFADLRDRASRVGAALRRLAPDEISERGRLSPWETGQPTVATCLLSCPEYLEILLGGFAGRLATFNVNYRYTASELAYLFNDADAAIVVYHERFAPTISDSIPLLRRIPALVHVADGSGNEPVEGAHVLPDLLDGDVSLLERPSPDDLFVLYTGGTTGMPKGTLWRQRDLWDGVLGTDLQGVDVELIAREVADRPSARILCLPPLMHGAGQWVALRSLFTGNTVVLSDINDHFDAEAAVELIERDGIAAVTVVGDAFGRPLVEEMERRPEAVSTLQLVLNGGATLSASIKQRLLAAKPGLVIRDSAGASETGAVLSAVSTGSVAEPGVFDPAPGATVLDVSLVRELEPGEDEIGWFATAGHLPLGYLGDEAKTQATFPTIEGIRYSVPGDRACRRADGRIELLGRDAVTINSGGEKIFAEEVEQAILQAKGVRDVVVVGRPSERWGSEVVAVVETESPVTDEEILEVAATTLARYKLPKAIVRVDAVIRSPSGKADYGWARSVASND